MSSTSQRLVWALQCLGLALIAARLAAPLLTEQAAWGLWPANYLPSGLRWALGLGAAGLVIFGGRLSWPRRRGWQPGGATARLAVALLCAIPFYLFRIQHTRWGDAYILVNAIPHPEVRLTYVWQAPLDVFLHAKAWGIGHRLFGWPDPIPVYWILSTAAGVAFVWVLWGLASEMGRNRLERLLIGGLVGTLGTMQLFFGYIENYTLMTLGMLLFLWLAWRTLEGRLSLAWPATALAVTNALHPSTLILLPGLAYVALRVRSGRGLGDRLRFLVPLVVPYGLVFGGVIALMTAGGHGLDQLFGPDAPGGGDHRWFVPLFQTTTRWERYTMFSPGHLSDIVNQQLLVGPAIWPGVILVVALAWRRIPWRDPALRFLGLTAVLYLGLTLVWNPDYGGQRDWDLFAPAAVPAALWLGYLLPRALPERNALLMAAWALVPPQAFATLAWVYQNTLPWSWP